MRPITALGNAHVTSHSRWINLVVSASFMLIAASTVFSFLTFDGALEGHAPDIFLEYIAIVGGLALAAVYVALGERQHDFGRAPERQRLPTRSDLERRKLTSHAASWQAEQGSDRIRKPLPSTPAIWKSK